jgi:hypothetical protein
MILVANMGVRHERANRPAPSGDGPCLRVGLRPSVGVVVKMGVAGAQPHGGPALGPGVPSVARTARNAVTATRVTTMALWTMLPDQKPTLTGA